MKFESEYRSDGSFLLRAVPGEFDAVPIVEGLALDWAPAKIEPGRLGLAAYLAFGAFASGELDFPSPIGPELAAAIDIDTAPMRLRCHGIDLAPKRLPRGKRAILVGTEPRFGGSIPCLAVVSAAVARGCLTWQGSTVACSNSSVIGAPSRGLLAVAVLLADELDVGEIRFEPYAKPSVNEMNKLQVLLQAVGLGIG